MCGRWSVMMDNRSIVLLMLYHKLICSCINNSFDSPDLFMWLVVHDILLLVVMYSEALLMLVCCSAALISCWSLIVVHLFLCLFPKGLQWMTGNSLSLKPLVFGQKYNLL